MRHDLRALRDQVIHVRRPILDRRITDPRVRRNVNFDNAAMERALGILRRGTALNVVNLSAFVRDNQRPLELADIRRIQPEIRLKREIDLDALGDVNERTARPDGAVQRCEFIITIRDDRPEKLPEKIGVYLKYLVILQELEFYMYSPVKDVAATVGRCGFGKPVGNAPKMYKKRPMFRGRLWNRPCEYTPIQ